MEIGVEWGLYGKVTVEDALGGEIADGILHRGIGLQWHVLLQPVDVDAGDEWFLRVIV